MNTRLAGPRSGLAALVLVAAGLAGCGNDDSSAAEQVPDLSHLLETVDQAVVEGRYVVARRQLDALVELTIESQESGELDDGDADRILAAAAQLHALLPEPFTQQPEDDPTTSSPSPEPSAGTGGGDGRGGDGGGGGGDGDKKDDNPGKGKGKGKGPKGKGRSPR